MEHLQHLKAKLVGKAPLIMHNGRLCDRMNPHTRAIAAVTSKRKKTDVDLEDIKQLEWRGGLYEDENETIVIPADLVLAVVLAGAKKNKNGQETKAGVYEACPNFPLVYDGPKDIAGLWADGRFCDYRGARVGTARVMRARPIFRNWAVVVELLVDSEIINTDAVLEALVKGGERCGLGDFRPRYGRFGVVPA